jgi:hypothetical protein
MFHLGIALTMRLGIFPSAMLAMYPVLLLPDEVERARRWVVGRVRRRAAPPGEPAAPSGHGS